MEKERVTDTETQGGQERQRKGVQTSKLRRQKVGARQECMREKNRQMEREKRVKELEIRIVFTSR